MTTGNNKKTAKKTNTLKDELHFGVRQAEFAFQGKHGNPALIFLAMRVAFASAFETSWYVPRGRQAYAARVRRILVLLNAEIDQKIEDVVKHGRGKLKGQTLEALQDWKRKLPALLALDGLVKPMLQGVPLVTVYRNPQSKHLFNLESPEQAAWRLASELVREIRAGNVGDHVADGIALKTFKHMADSGLLCKKDAARFVLAVRDSSKPIPKMSKLAAAPKKAKPSKTS